MESTPQEKINGLIALLSIMPKYNRTEYPYNQLGKTNILFTKNKITILARKDAQRAALFTVAKPDTDLNHAKDSKPKKGGSDSVSGGHSATVMFYA